MTIYEMLYREDIYGIMEKTLNDYYKIVYNEDVEVKVERSVIKNYYIIYPRLGVVMARIPSAGVLRDIYSQFNVQGNIMRKIAAWGYITLCVLSFGLIGSRSLRIGNKAFLKRNVYIMPCNRKIRIFNYCEGYVDAILKDGFSDYNFINEIKHRKVPDYGFIPGLLKSGNRWYRESIIKGTGLVRLPEPIYSEKVTEIQKLLRPFYNSHYQEVDANSYAKKLAEYIENRIHVLKEEKNIESTNYIKNVISRCMGMINHEVVPLATTHGDLQTGNILIENESGKIYIYDWETAGERSIWYDMGRLLLYSQRKDKYAYMVNNRKDEKVKRALLFFDQNKNRNMDLVIAVLILEELVAFTEEICELPGCIGTEIMDRLTSELKQTEFA